MKAKLTAMALAAGVTLGAWADTETVGGIVWNYTVSAGKAQVGIGGYNGTRAVSTSTTGAITIPPTLGGNPVIEHIARITNIWYRHKVSKCCWKNGTK